MKNNIIVRKMRPSDLEGALAVERSAIKGNNHYLSDAYDYYTSTLGELSVACIDQQIVGIGKFSILFDGSAWLELLRVHEDFQKQGVGQAIYQRYMEQAKTYGCQRIALYTGIRNIGSCRLATRHNLTQDTFYTSFSCIPSQNEPTLPFHLLNHLPTINITVPHLCINHTFYSVNEATLRGFLSQGYIYQYEDTLLIMGSRFQPYKALYIAYISGSHIEAALDYAIHHAYHQGIEKIIYHMPSDDLKHIDLLKQYHFQQDPGEDLVMTWVQS